MTSSKIIELLPYTTPFLFVDTLEKVEETGVTGTYTFPTDSYFYEGHFKNHPVTPGVILTETMAQIGVVCLGIYLLGDQMEALGDQGMMALVSSEVEFLLPVFPGELVRVVSEKVYFRFGKLKCKVEMRNAAGDLVCKGVLAGMIRR